MLEFPEVIRCIGASADTQISSYLLSRDLFQLSTMLLLIISNKFYPILNSAKINGRTLFAPTC